MYTFVRSPPIIERIVVLDSLTSFALRSILLIFLFVHPSIKHRQLLPPLPLGSSRELDLEIFTIPYSQHLIAPLGKVLSDPLKHPTIKLYEHRTNALKTLVDRAVSLLPDPTLEARKESQIIARVA